MRLQGRMGFGVLCLMLAGVVLWAAESRDDIVKRLWPKERIEAALRDVDKQRADGLIMPKLYDCRVKMLRERLAGTFKGEMLATTNPPLNFIQNEGFEEINRNSAPNRSRWQWWGGWDWGGNYENMWEERPEYVHSGKFSARIACKGARGRIGIATPNLPVVEGAKEYEFTIWAKGTGNNELFINFEEGASGTWRNKVPADWTEIKVRGTLEAKAKNYMVYIYVTGEGTIWLDDAKMVPVGVKLED